MSIWQSIVLGIVQGITEFLPVSSSGHLIIFKDIIGVNNAGALKSYDIALHFGTLLAMFLYFRKDFWEMIKALIQLLKNKLKSNGLSEEVKDNLLLIKILIVGTIPAIIVALIFGDLIDEYLLNPRNVSIMMVVVALVFILAEKTYQNIKPHQKISWKEGILIGLSQCLALIPGVSRSGSTISTGLFLGIQRDKAARFSFLLGSIAILAATLFTVMEVILGKYTLPNWDILGVGVITSFLIGLLSIHFLLNFLRKHSLEVFAWYRIILILFYIGIPFIWGYL